MNGTDTVSVAIYSEDRRKRVAAIEEGNVVVECERDTMCNVDADGVIKYVTENRVSRMYILAAAQLSRADTAAFFAYLMRERLSPGPTTFVSIDPPIRFDKEATLPVFHGILISSSFLVLDAFRTQPNAECKVVKIIEGNLVDQSEDIRRWSSSRVRRFYGQVK